MNRIKQKEHIFSITKKDVTNQSPVMDANVGEDLQELLEKLGTLITPKLVTTEESQDWEKRRMAKRRAEYAAISSIPKHYVDLYNSGELPDLQTEQARDLVVAGQLRRCFWTMQGGRGFHPQTIASFGTGLKMRGKHGGIKRLRSWPLWTLGKRLDGTACIWTSS
jgi:hypothetical protein